jgi:chromosome segregation ATPase
MNHKDEKLLREFVRRTIVNPAVKVLREEKRREDSVRLWVRSQIREFQEQQFNTIISEAKDMANPHPSTGINKLRDAIRKAKPSIKTKFQQLTTSSEQRESFTNHLLAAFVRLFDQLDALSAEGNAEDVASDETLAAEPAETDTLQAPDDGDIDDIEKELDSLMEALTLTEEEEEELGDDNDVVSDELTAEKESAKNLSQVEKDVEKKKSQDLDREQFGGGLEGDSTGRNQAYDTFNLVQSYFSDAYLDLNNSDDKEMYKKWGLYNLKLLLDSYEEELSPNLDTPDIQNPQ